MLSDIISSFRKIKGKSVQRDFEVKHENLNATA
jgi:hypothetical protein